MRLNFAAYVNVMTLTCPPVTNRRTFYGKLEIGARTFWLQRWDTARCMTHKPFAFSRDRLMCWTAGIRQPSPPAEQLSSSPSSTRGADHG